MNAMMLRYIIAAMTGPVLIAASVIISAAAPPTYETSIAKRLAPKYHAKLEVRLWDGARADLVSDKVAWEVDWAKKWAEGVGQALYYAQVLEKEPGVILLTKDRKSDARYIYRCQTVCAAKGIRLRIEEVNEDGRIKVQ